MLRAISKEFDLSRIGEALSRPLVFLLDKSNDFFPRWPGNDQHINGILQHQRALNERGQIMKETAAEIVERMKADLMNLGDMIGFTDSVLTINDQLDYLAESVQG